jgi:hypothetical protein
MNISRNPQQKSAILPHHHRGQKALITSIGATLQHRNTSVRIININIPCEP